MEITLPVVFTADRRYLPHFATAMVSFLENNPGNHQIFLVSEEIVDEELEELREILSERYASSLVLIPILPQVLEGFAVSGHISAIAYARLLLADILPGSIERVLYLDSDLVVVGNILEPLEEAWNASLPATELSTATPLFAVKEDDGRHLRRLGFSSTEYFNSGVMLINLKVWRKHGYSASLVATAQRNRRDIMWWDQDVLNLFFEGRWANLDSTLNRMVGQHHEHGLIFHFNSQEKPWLSGFENESAVWYRMYREKTPFVPFTPQFSLRAFVLRWAPIWIGSFIKHVRNKLRG